MRLGSCLGIVFALLFAQDASSQDARVVGRYTFETQGQPIGGLSGLEMSSDGVLFAAVSDKGLLIEGEISRASTAISHVTVRRQSRLLGAHGRVLRGLQTDAEALAIAPDGRIYVAFEQEHRILTQSDPTARMARLPGGVWMDDLDSNSGIEALAIDKQGTLFSLTETSKGEEFIIHAYEDGTWREAGRVPDEGGFNVTGADIDHQGTLFILERRLALTGFQSRVRSWTAEGTKTLFASRPGAFDNLEGIAAWRDQDGARRLTLVSDNNFLALQKTEFVELRLTQ